MLNLERAGAILSLFIPAVWQEHARSSSPFLQILWDACEKNLLIVFEKKYFESAKVPWPMYAIDGQVNTTYTYFPQTDEPAKLASDANRGWTQVAAKQTQLSAQRSMMTDLIYTWGTLAHTSGQKPYGLNVLWGDGHINFCTTRAAFDTKLWGGTGGDPISGVTPGDNTPGWRTIVSFLRPYGRTRRSIEPPDR
jgi:prepilin-type processing-associated H-X9-DG protein